VKEVCGEKIISIQNIDEAFSLGSVLFEPSWIVVPSTAEVTNSLS